MENNIKICKAELDDLEEILTLQKECYISEAEIINDFNIPPLKQTIDSIKDEYNYSVILKAVLNHEIIGSVRGYKKDNTCYIGKVIVKPQHQNKGLGKKLLSSIEDYFSGCEFYELFTGFKSEKNLYIYIKAGYKEFKREKISDKLTMVFLHKLNEIKVVNRTLL